MLFVKPIGFFCEFSKRMLMEDYRISPEIISQCGPDIKVGISLLSHKNRKILMFIFFIKNTFRSTAAASCRLAGAPSTA